MANASQSTSTASSAGASQTMEGASIIDPATIPNDNQPCSVDGNDFAANMLSPVVIDRPAQGETSELTLNSGQNYMFDFAEGDVASMVQNCGNLVVTFKDGSKLVLANFGEATAAEFPAVLAFAPENAGDGLIIKMDEIVDVSPDVNVLEDPQAELREEIILIEPAAGDVQQEEGSAETLVEVEPAAGEAQQAAQIEPAAGDQAGGGADGHGYGFQSSFDAQGVIPLADVGPIGPTALAFTLPEVNDDPVLLVASDDFPFAFASIQNIDETDLGPLVVNGQVNVDFGNDGPGTIAGNDTFTFSGSATGPTLTACGETIEVTSTATGYVGTITTGPMAGTIAFDLVINSNGTYTFTQYHAISHADATDPNDVINLNFGVRATDQDGDFVDTGIQINIADDAPVAVDGDGASLNEADLSAGSVQAAGNIIVDFGSDGANDVDAVYPNGTYSFDGVTDLTSGGQAIAISATADGYEGKLADGSVAFEIAVDDAGDYVFTQHLPLDHDPSSDLITLNFGVDVKDCDGDTDDATIRIDIADSKPDINDLPSVGAGIENVDETDLPGGATASGQLNIDFGADGTGSVTSDGNFTADGSLANDALTACGEAVTVTATADGYVGSLPNGDTVFTLAVDNTGAYTFTQYIAIDHADSSDPDDVISLHFGVQATDGDGDSDSGTITINVADDGPVASDVVETVGEGNLVSGSIVETGNVSVDFGNDGAAHNNTAVTPNGDYDVDGVAALTSGGQAVSIAQTAGGYVGTLPGGEVVFRLTLDRDTGEYTFRLNAPLDHDDAGRDVITLNFGVDVRDCDGDTDDATISINVTDDIPTITGDSGSVDETDLPGDANTSGQITFGYGEDGAGDVSSTGNYAVSGSVAGGALTSDGEAVTITATATGYVGTLPNGDTVFTLILQNDGAYTFDLQRPLDHADPTDPNDIITIAFEIQVTDGDGDTATGNITIDIYDDGPVVQGTEETIDEADLENGPVTETGILDIDFGSDGVGSVTPDGDQPRVTGVADLTSGGQPVEITATANGYVGKLPNGSTVFELVINEDTGSYAFTQNLPLDHDLAIDTISIAFGVDVTDNGGDTANADIVINIVDSVVEISDAPEIGKGIENVDETDLGPSIATGQLDIDFGGDGAGSVVPNGSFTPGGSLANNALTSCGQTVTVETTANGYVGTLPNGDVVFTLTVNNSGAYVFTQNLAIDHADGSDPDDVISLQFGVTATDGDGDSDTGTITINVADDGPIASGASESVDEGDLANGAIVETGNITVDYGNDGASHSDALTPNGTPSFDGAPSLASGGQAVAIAATADGYEGKLADGSIVFTIVITDAATGAYTFTQNLPLDHTAANDTISLTFPFQAQDCDGDTAQANIVIAINDSGVDINDAPAIGAGIETVDETNLPGGSTASGKLDIDFGGDGQGSVDPTGHYTIGGSLAGGNLTSGGQAVTITATTDGYVGKLPDGSVVFTLDIQDDGSYAFTQNLPLDHADGSNINDVISIVFEVEATDGDGDSDTGTITINIRDDAPIAVDDVNSIATGQTQATGNVITENDTVSNDTPTRVTNVHFDGVDYPVVQGAATVINGDYGVLSINADGSYTYTSNGTNATTVQDQFTYTIIDRDGDTSDALLTITIQDIDTVPVVTVAPLNVDETDLSPTDTDSGTVVADFGADGAGEFLATGVSSFSFGGSVAGSALTSNGHAVTVALVGNTYIGSANGAEVFRLELNQSTGAYDFLLTGTLDHADTTNPDDNIVLNFGVTVTDGDTNTAASDTAQATIVVNVRDDGPDAVNDGQNVSSTTPVSGNVMANDDVGADVDGVITQVMFNGTATAVPASGSVNVVGAFGTLSISADGVYTYTANAGADGVDQFTYTLRDSDGDTDTAVLSVNVSIDTVPVITNIVNLETDDTNITDSDSGSMTADFGQDGAGTYEVNGGFESAGSRTGGVLTSNGNAVGVEVDGNDYVGTIADGTEIFRLTLNETTGQYTFTQNGPLDHSLTDNPDEIITLRFGVTVHDGDTNRSAIDSDSGVIVVRVRDDAPVSISAHNQVDETDLGGAGGVAVIGNALVDFGQDGAGSVVALDGWRALGSVETGTLRHEGTPVEVTLSGNTYTGTAGGVTVFTLEVQADGQYTFTLLDSIDHADRNDPNDVINLEFDVSVVDFDGDSANGVITIDVYDDGPRIISVDPAAAFAAPPLAAAASISSTADIDESNLELGAQSVDGQFVVDFGNDGPGTILPNGEFQPSGSLLNGALTSGGQAVDVTFSGNTYTGALADGSVIFTLEILDIAQGTHTFTLFAPLDHADGSKENDEIVLRFGVRATDDDGDFVDGFITRTIADDAPVAENDDVSVGESQTVTGNVTDNDDAGSDNHGTIVSVNGTDIPASGLTINGTYGVLTINRDGSYSYTANSNNPNGVDTFTYVLRDFDGDTDTAELSFTVSPLNDVPVITNIVNLATDDSDLAPTDSDSGSITATFGSDGAGTYEVNDTFSSAGNRAGNALTSNGVAVSVAVVGNDYVGTAGGAEVFRLSLNEMTGEYTFTQSRPLDHSDTNADNEAITLRFGVDVSDGDGDTSAGDTASGTIVVTVRDDAPVAIDDNGGNVESGDSVSGNVTGNDNAGEDAPGSVVAVNGTSIPVSGLTVNGTYGVLVIDRDGSYTYTANDNTVGGVDTFTYTLRDFDGDTDTAKLSFAVGADDVPQLIAPALEVVDETNLAGGNEVRTGTIDVDFGSDGPGTIAGNGAFDFSGSAANDALTHNGSPVAVTLSGNTYTGTAADGTDVFTLVVRNDGSYTFTLLDTLDHADPNDPNDIIRLRFGVVATDADGDTGTTTILVDVKDDAPSIGDSQGGVDEINLDNGVLTASDTLETNFGADVGSVAPNGNFSVSAGGNPLTLTSGGNAVAITQTANGYEGKLASGATVFTLSIDATTGQWTYTQSLPLDHPDAGDANDIIRFAFDVDVTSVDGDSDTGTIVVRVADDGPVAVGDVNGAEEGQLITGDVIANDDLSTDGGHVINQITFNGTNFTIPAGGRTVVGDFGTLTIQQDGSYTYQANNNDPDGMDTFTYRIRDFDGDTDTANLVIRVSPDGQPVAVDDAIAVDETNLTPGPMVFNDRIEIDFGLDGQGGVSPNGSFQPGGSLLGGNLTSGGQAITVEQTATGYVGTAGGRDIFTITFQDNGEYTFTLLDHIDHADASDPNDAITLRFGVTVSDSDGDTTDVNVTVTVHDDAPVAIDDNGGNVAESATVTGNVTDNDELGEDTPNTVISVNGTTIPASGLTINGTYGVLTIARDGSYSYTANSDNPQGVDRFTYVLRDFDGDTDTAELSFTVSPLNDVPVITNIVNLATDDSDLNPTDSDSGSITATFGSDGEGTYEVNDTFSSAGNLAGNALTSNGVAVNVTVIGNDYVGTAGGAEVFRLTLSETTGEYTFTQSRPLDHSDTNANNEAITLRFGVDVSDGDSDTSAGDTASGTIVVTVRDDAPVAVDDGRVAVESETITGNVTNNDDAGADVAGTVISVNGTNIPAAGLTIAGNYGVLTIQRDGSYSYTANADNPDGADTFTYALRDRDGDVDLAVLSVVVSPDNDVPVITNIVNLTTDDSDLNPTDSDSGSITATFGSDGEGTYEVNDTFSSAGSRAGNALTSNGVAVSVTVIGNDYVGTAGGAEVFRLTLNETTGEYTFTQSRPLDHSDTNANNEAITLRFGVDVSDGDSDTSAGDTASGTIVVTVRDDAPVAVDDNGGNLEEGGSTSGNVITNDDAGEDAPGTIVAVNGTSIPAAGLTVNGTYGVLVIDRDGSYTYTANNNSTGGVDRFTYTLRDFDGDTDTADLSFTVTADDDPIVGGPAPLVVDETDLNPTDSDSDTIDVDFGNDAPGAFTATGAGTFTYDGNAGSRLTSDGQRVNVSVDGNDYVGRAGGQEVFRLELNRTTGQYEFILLGVLDHADTSDPNDAITLNFGVTVSDNDGDSVATSIAVRVLDDGPVANNDSAGGAGRTFTGNVLTNDVYSEDTPNTMTSIRYQGVDYGLPANGNDITINSSTGVLTINNTGAYTFVQHETVQTFGNDDAGWTIITSRPGGTISFTYTLQDEDGDIDTANLNVTTQPYTDIETIPGCPLVLDLDGDGIELVTTENGVLFDMGPDGHLEQTAWVAADDGLLAIDLNGDGIINDHSELFGTMTTDGFTILGQYDSNADGVIDANDDAFDQMLVWQDVNQDGYSDADELFGLNDLGIVSIDLNAQDSTDVVNGSPIILTSTFNYADGSEGQIGDALFNFDQLDVLYASHDADTFIFDAANDDTVLIRGFDTEDGDALDLSALIEGYDPLSDAINDFVHTTERDGDTIVSVNTGDAFHAVAVLENVTNVNLDDILKDNTSIAA